jgi:hypothetical protein
MCLLMLPQLSPAPARCLLLLQVLDLQGNRLHSAPLDFPSPLPSLHHVDLSSNAIEVLPANISNLQGLMVSGHSVGCGQAGAAAWRVPCMARVLGWGGWGKHHHLLPGVPSHGSSTACCGATRTNSSHPPHAPAPPQSLDLRHNCLTSLPASITTLRALTHLAAANNRLSELPASLGSGTALSSLRSLDLQRNCLASLPACLSGLVRLTQLQLQGSSLLALPEGLGRLGQLEHLDVSGNQLGCLPDSCRGLTALRVLDASGNQLEAFPKLGSALLQVGRRAVMCCAVLLQWGGAGRGSSLLQVGRSAVTLCIVLSCAGLGCWQCRVQGEEGGGSPALGSGLMQETCWQRVGPALCCVTAGCAHYALCFPFRCCGCPATT